MSSRILIVDYDPHWPELFAREAHRIRSLLGSRALRIEHAGSTSVPGLVAKPIIDVVLMVADSAEEDGYAPALDAAGYVLRIRELARSEWQDVQNYADAKTAVVAEILPGKFDGDRGWAAAAHSCRRATMGST